MKRTTHSNLYETVDIGQSGHGVTGTYKWEIRSAVALSHEEVDEVIETKYPVAGYGNSHYFRKVRKSTKEPFVIEVHSNASCD